MSERQTTSPSRTVWRNNSASISISAMPPPPPLTSAQLKFDRGCEHLNALHKAIGLFLANKKTYSVLDEYDPQTQGYVRFLEAAPVPDEVSLLIGDAGHNFRSCLDHIAWQLAAAENPKGNITDHRKESEVSFPIYASRRKYLRSGNEPGGT